MALRPGTSAGNERSDSDRRDLVINPEGPTYDSNLALAAAPDGATWAAWHAYHGGRDRIVARRIGPAELGPAWTVSDEGRVHAAPAIAALADDRVWVVWPTQREKRWRLVGRQFQRMRGGHV